MKSIYIRKTFEILLLLCAVLMASCSSGSGYNDMDETGSLTVTLSINGIDSIQQSSISAGSDVKLSEIAFFYKATPQWTAKSVTGSTGGSFIRLSSSSYSDRQLSLGQFKAGEWRFDVEVRKIDSTRPESGWTVLLSGSAVADLEKSGASVNVNIEVNVDLEAEEGGTTTVGFDMAIPIEGSLVITYTRPDGTKATVPESAITYTEYYNLDADGNRVYDPDWKICTIELEDIPSGEYTLDVEYQENGQTITTTTIEVSGMNGQSATVAGTISPAEDDGLSRTTLRLTLPYLIMELGQEGTSFTCTVTEATSEYDICWFVNGVQQSGQTGTGFVLTGDAPGAYDVTCTASIEGKACSMTQTVYVSAD